MRESFFQERNIYFRENGRDPEKITLLFVHGLSGSSSVWRPYEKAFESDYNIISPDLRGHGKSHKLLFYSAYSPELIAADLLALLDHLSIQSCIVIGHSFGTLLALASIRQDPRRFSAAVFLSPTYGAWSAWWLCFAHVVTFLFSHFSLLLPFDPGPKDHVDYSKFAPTGDWSPRRIIQDIRNTSLRVYFFCVKQVYDRKTASWWKDISMPVLIVHGTKDTIIPPAEAIKLSHIIPGAKLVLRQNANHILPVNNVPEVSKEIATFLDSLH